MWSRFGGQPQARHVIKKEDRGTAKEFRSLVFKETARILEKRKDRERREAWL